MSTLLIQGGLLVDTEWTRHADILVDGPKIVKIANKISEESLPDGTEIVQADGLCVLPGLIDAHTHYHLISRGTVTADSFEEGSKLAAFGGVTTVVDFADDDKKGDLKACARARVNAMKKSMAIDFSLHQGVYAYRPGVEKELEELKKAGIRTIKIFTTYKNVGYLIDNPDELKELFQKCKDLDMLVCVHCEDDALVTKISDEWKGTYLPKDHADLRPSEVEARGIETVAKIALELDMSLYIVHLSSKKGLEVIRKYRDEGLDILVETTPHYLFLDRSKLEGDKGPLYVMTPPLRDKEDNLALQEALMHGEIQVVATDHCTFTYDQKLEQTDCRYTYPGIPGTEELLVLLNTFAFNHGAFGLSQVVNLLSTGPAKAFGLYPQKGNLRAGADADIVLFNPDETWTITNDNIHSASNYSVYDGFKVTGKVKATYLRGRLIMSDDVYLGIPGDGLFVKQQEVHQEKNFWK
ncbi:MAG: dihydroorotase [Pleomorphochaeta sp.]|jgi:dihydropyrimidinase